MLTYTRKFVNVSNIFSALENALCLAPDTFNEEFDSVCDTTFGDASHTLITLDKFKEELERCDAFNAHEQAPEAWERIKAELRELEVTHVDLEHNA